MQQKKAERERSTPDKHSNHGGVRFATAVFLMQVFERWNFQSVDYDFVDSHFLSTHRIGQPFRNIKGWLGITKEDK